MSTVHGSMFDLEGRFLGKDDAAIEFLVMPGATRIRVPVLEESLGRWKTAEVGQTITVRISQSLATRLGLFGGGTMGTFRGRLGNLNS